ncbi:hypothetical protein ERJ75_001378000 [Trypanosoma vivax]|nr:hypothetical protein ERJ75_001378000 [Trypanosoma vivax]
MRRFRGQEEGDSSECLGGGRHVVPVLVPTDFGSRRQAGLWGDSGAAQPNQRDAVHDGGGRNRRAGLPERKAGPGTGNREGVCGRREMARGTKCGRGRLNRRKGKRETKDGTGKCSHGSGSWRLSGPGAAVEDTTHREA